MHSSRVYFLITHRIQICPQTLNYACWGQISASCREIAKPRRACWASPQRTSISPALFQTFACENNRICINKLKSIKSSLSPQFPSHTRQLEPKCRGCCGDFFYGCMVLAFHSKSPSASQRAKARASSFAYTLVTKFIVWLRPTVWAAATDSMT